jgi:hypothetical protein
VVSGKSYVRELSVIRKTRLEQWAAPLRAIQPEDAPLNVLGQVYSKQFQADLSALDPARLLKDAADKPASRALIFDIGLLVYGTYDSGLGVVTTHFGKDGKSMSRSSSIRGAVFDELDQALFGPTASEKVMAACASFIKRVNTPALGTCSAGNGGVDRGGGFGGDGQVNFAGVLRCALRPERMLRSTLSP